MKRFVHGLDRLLRVRAGTTATSATFVDCWLEPRTGTPARRSASIILPSVAG